MLRIFLFAMIAGAICGCGSNQALESALLAGEEVEPGRYSACMACHGLIAQGDQEKGAPALSQLPADYLVLQMANIRDGIRTAAGCAEALAAHEVADELADLAKTIGSYTAVWPAPSQRGGNVKNGKKIFSTCLACHAPDGSGFPALAAPPLIYQHDWYLRHTLQEFRTGARGTHELDRNGKRMSVGIGSFVPSDAAVLDVVAYINSLKEDHQ